MKWKTYILLTTIMIILASLTSAFSTEGNHSALTANTVAYWQFENNNATWTADSTGKNNGTILGAVLTNGMLGNAYEFDGMGDYITISSATVSSTSFTTSLWFKGPIQTQFNRIIGLAPDNNGENIIYKYLSSGTLAQVDFEDGSNGHNTIISTDAVFDESWHHLVMSNDGTTNGAKFYVDGLLQGTTNQTVSFDMTEVVMGARTVTYDTYINGTIDEVMIFNKSLSASEISTLYNEQKDKLAGKWNFDGNATDSSKYNNYGTVVGAGYTNKGKFSGAYEFDGTNDYIYMADNYQLDIGLEDFTACAWFKTLGASSNTNILTKREGGLGNGYMMSLNSSGSVFVQLIDTNSYAAPISSESFNDGKWHQACMIADRTAQFLNVTVDGINRDGADTISEPGDIDSIRTLTIGSLYYASGRFNGTIDEVQLYHKALSPSEILELYNQSLESHKFILQGTPENSLFESYEGTHTAVNLSDQVLHMRFEGNANDETGINNGTLVGNTILGNGIIGQGYNFDGNGDYISKTSFTGLNTSYLTVCAWAKRKDTGRQQGIVQTQWVSTTTFRLIYLNTNAVAWQTRNATTIAGSSTGVISTNEWHFFCGTYSIDDSLQKIYLDGILVDSDLQIGVLGAGTTIEIGRDVGVDSYSMNGSIDEVLIYNRSLNSTEILDLYNAQKPKGDLVGYWKLDGNADDSSNYDNHGTVTDAIYTNKGKFSGAYTFDGAGDYISAGDIDETDNAQHLTVSAWVKPVKFNDYGAVIYKMGGVSDRWIMGLSGAGIGGNDDVIVGIYNDSSSYGYTNANVLSLNVWQHWVMVYDGTQSGVNANALKFYLNGVQKSLAFSGTIPAWTDDNTASVVFGSNTGVSSFFNGSIDELKIYNRSLSATEILALYNQSLASNKFVIKGTPSQSFLNDPNLVSKWSFDGNANDKTGMNNGTITGATYTNKGKFGGAYEFDGIDDGILTSGVPWTDNVTGMAVSSWVYIKEFGSNAPIVDWCYAGASAFKNGFCLMANSDDKFYFTWGNGTSRSNIATTNTYTPNQWYHVAGTVNTSGYGTIYIDGVKSGGVAGAINISTFDIFNIGKRRASTLSYFNGTIDELVVWNRSLSATEISALYNQSIKSNRFVIKGVPA